MKEKLIILLGIIVLLVGSNLGLYFYQKKQNDTKINNLKSEIKELEETTNKIKNTYGSLELSVVKVPYAKVEIASGTTITAEMIAYEDVPGHIVKNKANLLTNASDIVGKVVSQNHTIPRESYFYSPALDEKNQMPNNIFNEIPDGYIAFYLDVTLQTTYGNSILPGDKISLYFKGTDDEEKVIYDEFVTNIKVLAVRDTQGQDVFNTTEARTPSVIIFAVPNDIYTLLSKATGIKGAQLLPVPLSAAQAAAEGEVQITSEKIKDFILSKSIT